MFEVQGSGVPLVWAMARGGIQAVESRVQLRIVITVALIVIIRMEDRK